MTVSHKSKGGTLKPVNSEPVLKKSQVKPMNTIDVSKAQVK